MKFKGFDWTELTEHWGIPDCEDESVTLEQARQFLHNTFMESTRAEVCKDIRKFLKALQKDSEKWSYSGPFWKGLRKIKDDDTLIQYVVELLPCMWS